MKKVYVASRTAQKSRARALLKQLEEKGYTSLTDWLDKPMLKPYEENQAAARKYSEKYLNLILDCDYFVLLSDTAGTGMYIELGAAMANQKVTGRPKVYVIGEHGANSIFSYHPGITWLADEQELLSQL